MRCGTFALVLSCPLQTEELYIQAQFDDWRQAFDLNFTEDQVRVLTEEEVRGTGS